MQMKIYYKLKTVKLKKFQYFRHLLLLVILLSIERLNIIKSYFKKIGVQMVRLLFKKYYKY